MTIWSAGYKVRSIPDLPEDKAVQIGSEFVGESFILVVSAATVLFEYNRSKEKEELKAEQKRAEAAAEQHALQLKLHALDVRLQALEQVVESNSQSIFTYLQGGKQYVPPSAEQLVPISSVDGSNNNEKIEKENGDQNKSSEPESTEEAVLDSTERQLNEKQWWNWRPW
jgi:Optic atrophy 3 protein (OPA3)